MLPINREQVSAAQFAALVEDRLRDCRTPGASRAVRLEDREIAMAWTAMDYVVVEVEEKVAA